MLYKRKGSSVSFQEKKSSPLRFCFTKHFAMLWKNISLNQCYLWKQHFFQGLFLKKGYIDHQIIQISTLFQQTSTLFTEMWVSIEEIKQNGNGWCKGKYLGFVQKKRNFTKNQEMVPPFVLAYRPFSPKKLNFNENSSFLSKRFSTTALFCPKKQQLDFTFKNSGKTRKI